jgi:hypothetical protein
MAVSVVPHTPTGSVSLSECSSPSWCAVEHLCGSTFLVTNVVEHNHTPVCLTDHPYIFRSFVHFVIVLFIFLLLNYESLIYSFIRYITSTYHRNSQYAEKNAQCHLSSGKCESKPQ